MNDYKWMGTFFQRRKHDDCDVGGHVPKPPLPIWVQLEVRRPRERTFVIGSRLAENQATSTLQSLACSNFEEA